MKNTPVISNYVANLPHVRRALARVRVPNPTTPTVREMTAAEKELVGRTYTDFLDDLDRDLNNTDEP